VFSLPALGEEDNQIHTLDPTDCFIPPYPLPPNLRGSVGFIHQGILTNCGKEQLTNCKVVIMWNILENYPFSLIFVIQAYI
jgi:hypothetical protein